jgi:ankyrin repeat protein
LLDAGASVDEADADGITILSWAAISNRVNMASLLIERGADLNHAGKKGMAPLLYAASIDFGDSTMVDLLVQFGAPLSARNQQGRADRCGPGPQVLPHRLLLSLQGPRAAR